MPELDITNKAIVECLRLDASATNRAIGRALGVSEETVRRRILAMETIGTLQFGVTVSAEAEGMGISAMINVEADSGCPSSLLHEVPLDDVFAIRSHIAIDGNQIYEIVAATNRDVHRAVAYLKAIVGVRNATVTFLHTNGNLRI